MPWQPPIPAGALYSKAARDLGPALPLLAYCYDLVQRDGWFTLNLHDAASDMEESYPTIKRWWQNVAAGPFFAEVQARGRKGIRAHFKDIWIDWRILSTRKRDEIGPETGSEVIPNDETGDIRDGNGTETGSEVISSPRMYKVLHNDQESDLPTPTSSPTPHEQTQPDQQLVMMMLGKGIRSDKVLAQIASMGLDYATVEQSIDNLLDDNASIQSIVRLLLTSPPSPGNPYPRARLPVPAAAQNGNGNGKHLRQTVNGHSERKPQREANLDDGF